MTLHLGKLDRKTMEQVVFRSLGKSSSMVVKGPGRGLDNAVISVGGRRRMIVTTDPVSIIPALGMAKSAWLSVHLVASDYATSGLEPQFASFTYNLPRKMERGDAEEYIREMGQECERLGVAVVAGHTGSYPGAAFTVVGGGVMFGFCQEGEFVDPTMAKVGDSILMTKSAAIEAATTLANSFPRYVESAAGRVVRDRARMMLNKCSTVRDAIIASSCGLGADGVTSMHDATEGGILGALAEMADASKTAFILEKDKVQVAPETSAVCTAFGIDPLSTVSEGSLLLTCGPGAADTVRKKLQKNGIQANQIGTVRRGRGLWAANPTGRAHRISGSVDGYWTAYEKGVRAGLK